LVPNLKFLVSSGFVLVPAQSSLIG